MGWVRGDWGGMGEGGLGWGEVGGLDCLGWDG